MPSIPKRFKAVGVHIFAGGFSVGIRQAGFDVVAHLEGGKYGVSTARLNWPRLPIHVGEENWPYESLKSKKIDLVYCNPPCAIFSSAGVSTTKGKDAWRTDPRTDCWRQCFDAFSEIQPNVWAMESVTQAYTKGRELIDNFTEKCFAMGYSVKHVLMDAKWTGIPQSRRRFFFVAHQPWLKLDFMFSFHKPPTVGEILGEVDDPGHIQERKKDSKFKRMYEKCVRMTPPGGKLRKTFDDLHNIDYREVSMKTTGKIEGRPGFLVSRLHPGTQMGAFIGDVFIHPEENRLLGTNEMRALCGYPDEDGFKLDGMPSQNAALLARAVLPPVGKWLGNVVRRGILNGRVNLKKSVRLIDLRKPGINPVSLTKEYV